jgi:DNA-directed RNA polymerase specialized sigma24 family protein
MSKTSQSEPSSSAASHQLQVQRLFVKHQSVVKAYILSLLPSLTDAEDVLQETFLTVSAKAASFEPGNELRRLGLHHCTFQGAGGSPPLETIRAR